MNELNLAQTTITENSKPKAKAVGQRLAKALGQRFHDIKLIKE